MVFLKKLTLFTLPFLLSACGDDDLDSSDIGAPDTYQFASQTNPAAMSSVDYKEATTRIVLIKELQSLIASDFLQTMGATQGKAAVLATLNRVYSAGTQGISSVNIYDDLSTPTPITGVPTTLDKLQTDFLSMESSTNLSDKLPGVFTDLIYRRPDDINLGFFIGWNKSGINDGDKLSNLMIQDWFERVAVIAIDGDSETKSIIGGVNYQTLIGNFLNGAIPYYLSNHVLLNPSNGLLASNSSQSNYTQLQHNWDLAYGYFGANSHYKSKGKTINATQAEFDHNGDGKIDLFTEVNLGYAVDAAVMDERSILSDTYFSEDIAQAFLNGRQLINNHLNSGIADNAEFAQALLHEAKVISQNWERLIAAKLIHHLNKTSVTAPLYGQLPALDALYANDWANVKSYALALQFNPNAIITYDELIDLHAQIGTSPVIYIDDHKLRTYANKLLVARDKIANIYNFSEMNTLNW